MKQTTAEMIAAFKANGGTIEWCETGAKLGITTREWERLVRGEGEIVEVPVLRTAFAEMKLRAGVGLVA